MKKEYRRPATIPFPADNPYTLEKVILGKRLFFDPRLSARSVLSCATCHNPAFAWGDAQPKAVGHGMNVLERRTPTILNSAWGSIFMWDGRAGTLEEQALIPIQSEVEMNLQLEQMAERLAKVDEYRSLFTAAFPEEAITPENVAQALATYERTVVSGSAPFDAWIDGDETAISDDAKRGFFLFNTKAGCSGCHRGWNFTDDSFHDIGLPGGGVGRGKFFPNAVKMQHAFKTPTLRDIRRRAPYMHDGSLATLEATIDHYDSGGIDRPSRSDLIKPLGLNAQEKADLVAFLETLTSKDQQVPVPDLPR